MSRLAQTRALVIMLSSVVACADLSAEDVQPASREAPLAAPQVDHGALAFGAPIALTLDRSTPAHVFHFTLSAAAGIDLRTLAAGTGGAVDTVLSLYREPVSHALAVNDDDGRSRFSHLARSLPAGSYRVVVQGFKRSSEGSFQLAASCQGAGCPTSARPCLFGDTFYELRTTGLLSVLDEHWIRALSEITSELEGQQLVLAVQQSAHTDVTTPAEALAAVDQNEVRRMRLRDAPSGRQYDVFEYGAGDNSYGAIFRADSLVKAVSIHDGDLLECTER
jgi:hypothetical protein